MTYHYSKMAACAYGIRDWSTSAMNGWRKYSSDHKGVFPCSRIRCMNEVLHSAMKVRDYSMMLIPEAELEYDGAVEKMMDGIRTSMEASVVKGVRIIDLGGMRIRKTADSMTVRMPRIDADIPVHGFYIDTVDGESFLAIQCPGFEIRYSFGAEDERFCLPERYCDVPMKGQCVIRSDICGHIIDAMSSTQELKDRLKRRTVTKEEYCDGFTRICTENGLRPSKGGCWTADLCDSIRFVIGAEKPRLIIRGCSSEAESEVRSMEIRGSHAMISLGGDTFIAFLTEAVQ